jgi:hypothetical protein
MLPRVIALNQNAVRRRFEQRFSSARMATVAQRCGTDSHVVRAEANCTLAAYPSRTYRNRAHSTLTTSHTATNAPATVAMTVSVVRMTSINSAPLLVIDAQRMSSGRVLLTAPPPADKTRTCQDQFHGKSVSNSHGAQAPNGAVTSQTGFVQKAHR